MKDNGFPWPPPGIFVFSFEFERVIQIWRENQQKHPILWLELGTTKWLGRARGEI